jgi:RNA polymerase sigma-70 factor (ECF subfamily)
MTDSATLLLDLARKGDREAFASLVRRHLPVVHDVVLRTSKGRGVPAELVRETFHRAWRGLAGLSPRVDFARWLRGIARYVAHDAARRREPFSVSRRPGTGEQAMGRLLRALDALDPASRETILLRHLDRRSVAEIAETLGCEEQVVAERARLAREALRGRLPNPSGAEPRAAG